MSEDQKDRYIRYLAEQNQEHVLTEKAMESVLEDFMERQRLMEERMSSFESRYESLKAELSEKSRLLKSAERKVKTLESKLDYANQQLFGDRRQKVHKKRGSVESESTDTDCRGEKDDFDGTDDTLRTDSVGSTNPVETPLPPKKKRDLSGRPDAYKSMGIVGDPVLHPSDLSKVPGRIIERKTVQVFSLKTCLIEERFEMVHYVESGQKPKWGYFSSSGHPEVVTRFEGIKATPGVLQAIAYEVYVKNVTFGLLHQWLTDMGMTISANTLRNSNAYVFIGNELKSARFKDTIH